jgi:predicted phosphodiesterase
MHPILLIIVGVASVALILSVFNFPFLLYPFLPSLNPMTKASRMSLNGPSVFISDLHLRADRPFQYSETVRRMLETRHVSNLIVVGDLFDSPKDARMIAGVNGAGPPVVDLLGLRGLPVNAFLIEGSPPHDPSSKESATLNIAPLVRLGQCALLGFNQMTVIAYHGHHMSRKGAIGHGWERFISQLSLERAWKRLAGVPDSDWIIFGHTHIPGIDAKHRVANCGGWQAIGFLVRPACTGLLLTPESGSLEIVNFAQ